MKTKTKAAKVNDVKKKIVKNLANDMKKKTVMVVSIKGLPSRQYQDIKKKIRKSANIKVAKKSAIDFALHESGIKELDKLIPYVTDCSALLFSNEDAFNISGMLASEKSPAKAKVGDIAPHDIEVKAGPTDLVPGPDISALSGVGLTPKVEGGKISVVKDKVIVKAGAVITDKFAAIMSKLHIVPFKIGIEPVAAYCDGKIYIDIKVDKDGILEELGNDYSRSLAFAAEVAYVADETLEFILAKASCHEKAIQSLIKTDEAVSQSN